MMNPPVPGLPPAAEAIATAAAACVWAVSLIVLIICSYRLRSRSPRD
jgi:hypothetical protein